MEKKIATTLLGIGMSVAVIIGVVMAAIQIVSDYKTEVRENKVLVERVMLVAASGAREAAAQLSDRLAAEVIGPLLIYDFVSIAQIVDERGVTLARVSRSPDWTGLDRLTDLFAQSYSTYTMDLEQEDQDLMLGKFSVTIHNATMLSNFYIRSAARIVGGVLRNVIFVLILLALFHRRLTWPITALVQKLSRVDPRNPQPFEIPPDIKAAKNELTVLARTTNDILLANKVYLSEVRELQQQTETVSEQLRHSERLSAIGQLVGGVAHDFNNILAVILGTSELISDEESETERRKLLDVMQKATTKGANLTSQLLAYSRKQPLTPTPIVAADLFGGLEHLLDRTLGEQYSIELNADPSVWPCFADRQQLETVLMNLALNARDAMPQGGTIKITAKNIVCDPADSMRVPLGGDYVCFLVQDNGTGMDAHVAAHAFEPYFTTKRVDEGSGLGLAMAYGFAKQSRGHIEIDSAPGQGSTIRLYMPRSNTDESEDGAQAGNDQSARLPKFENQTLLIVEDDPSVLQIVAGQVAALGITAISAPSPEAALELFRRDRSISGALLDVILPGPMNGPDLADIFDRERPGFKIAFMSGYTDDAILPQAGEGGQRQLLRKPFTQHDLAVVLDRLLNAQMAAVDAENAAG